MTLAVVNMATLAQLRTSLAGEFLSISVYFHHHRFQMLSLKVTFQGGLVDPILKMLILLFTVTARMLNN